MAKMRGAIEVDIDKCKGCGLCVESCPEDVLSLAQDINAKGYHYSYMSMPDACIGCANCGTVCPDSVIEVFRYKPEKESITEKK